MRSETEDSAQGSNWVAIMVALNPKRLKLEETDMIVQSWLLQLGLTNRETIATIAMSRLKRSKREDTIRVCLKGLSMTEYQISSSFWFLHTGHSYCCNGFSVRQS